MVFSFLPANKIVSSIALPAVAFSPEVLSKSAIAQASLQICPGSKLFLLTVLTINQNKAGRLLYEYILSTSISKIFTQKYLFFAQKDNTMKIPINNLII